MADGIGNVSPPRDGKLMFHLMPHANPAPPCGRISRKFLFSKELAETEGFEPSVPFAQYDGLANRWFQPLTHVSAPVSAPRGKRDGLPSDGL